MPDNYQFDSLLTEDSSFNTLDRCVIVNHLLGVSGWIFFPLYYITRELGKVKRIKQSPEAKTETKRKVPQPSCVGTGHC
jgi:hypothetical protein